ncbi:hypothetical protein BKA70DRAFT_1045450, partial [Coprinopsis sp. MPI-PUGE-AT-0042]
IDESSVDHLTNIRHKGWSEFGRACVSRDTHIRGKRISILPALTSNGILTMDLVEGAVNKEIFISFVRDELVS